MNFFKINLFQNLSLYKLLCLLFLSFLFFSILFKEKYKKKEIFNNNPKISIFLPIYNKGNYLKKSIGSIQIQTLKEIEILPINDFSEDNTLKVLKKLAKNDSRIKIINNDRNRGLLYSRAMGILNSNGQYIMNLDPDDELSNNKDLEYLYNIAKKLNVDVITFGLIKNYGLNSNSTELFLCKNFNKIQFQPKIFNFSAEIKFDYLITNKLIKNVLFKKVFLKFKKQIYGEKWNYAEDEIWSTLINKYAKSKICVEKAIYVYNLNNNSLVSKRFNILYMKNLLNWIGMFKKILNNNNQEIYFNRLNFLISLIGNNEKFLNIIKNNKRIKNKYINLLKQLIYQINIKNVTIKYIIDSLEKKQK